MKGPSSTWTNLVTDDPFKNQIGMMLTGPGRTTFAIGAAAVAMPLLILWGADRSGAGQAGGETAAAGSKAVSDRWPRSIATHCRPRYRGQPVCGSPGVSFSAFWKYSFFSTASGRSMPYSFQNAW